jgi:hypothetical protein
MVTDLEVRRLVSFETATDGTTVRWIAEDLAGRSVGIVLTIEALTSLLMTLPTMVSNAVKRTHNDPAVRITYPLTDFQIELSPGNLRILTVSTSNGFSVSFSLTEELSEELGRAHLKGKGRRAKTH